MSRRGGSDLDSKIYVGDLPRDASEKEVERAFSYYGRLRSVWVARNPPGFAFVEFEDPLDADDAVRGLDGTSICGVRARVEHSSGKVRPKPWLRRGPPPSSRSRKAFDPSDRCYECGDRGHYAYDCSKSRSKRRGRSYSRSRSRSRDRRRSYSRSHSRERDSKRRRSRSRSRDRDGSRSPRDRSRSPREASPARQNGD